MRVLFLICKDGPWPPAATDAVAPPLPGSLYQDTPLDPELRYEVSSFLRPIQRVKGFRYCRTRPHRFDQ